MSLGWKTRVKLCFAFQTIDFHCHPLVDPVEALQIRDGFEQKIRGELSGRVVKVIDGDSIRVRDEQGHFTSIRLTGLEAPDPRSGSRTERHLVGESRTSLTSLVLSNWVRVQITCSNESGSALGVVFLGKTNVNAAQVESGMAHMKRDYMNGLPLITRYALVQADRLQLECPCGAIASQSSAGKLLPTARYELTRTVSKV